MGLPSARAAKPFAVSKRARTPDSIAMLLSWTARAVLMAAPIDCDPEIAASIPAASPEDSAEKVAEYEERFANPFVAASKGFIDEVIYPHSTRRRIALGLRKLRGKSLENPWKKHDNIPL